MEPCTSAARTKGREQAAWPPLTRAALGAVGWSRQMPDTRHVPSWNRQDPLTCDYPQSISMDQIV